jgi:hypothetical protein
MAPAWILLRQAQHQRPVCRLNRRTARPASGIGSSSGRSGCGANAAGWPGGPGTLPTAVGAAAWTTPRAPPDRMVPDPDVGPHGQHRDLMTKDQDLDLLRPPAPQAQHDQLQHLT